MSEASIDARSYPWNRPSEARPVKHVGLTLTPERVSFTSAEKLDPICTVLELSMRGEIFWVGLVESASWPGIEYVASKALLDRANELPA